MTLAGGDVVADVDEQWTRPRAPVARLAPTGQPQRTKRSRDGASDAADCLIEPVRNEAADSPRYSSSVAPRVLIIGGFLTMPLNYWPLRRRLIARGAAAVDIAPLWPVDWALAGVLGHGLVCRRTRLAICVPTRPAIGNLSS